MNRSDSTSREGPRQDEHRRAPAHPSQDPSAHASRRERPRMTEQPARLRPVLNALFVRLDYGPDAHYPDQDASGRALDRFVPSAALPRPIVVDAGDGLECYWPLTEAVPVGRWRRTARRLKAACMRHDLAAQHRTTTDPYALWRVPGTHNKALTPPFLAQVIDWGDGGDSRPSLEAAPRNIRHPRR